MTFNIENIVQAGCLRNIYSPLHCYSLGNELQGEFPPVEALTLDIIQIRGICPHLKLEAALVIFSLDFPYIYSRSQFGYGPFSKPGNISIVNLYLLVGLQSLSIELV